MSLLSMVLLTLSTRYRYENILKRIETSLHPYQWRYTKKLLGWLVCSKRPLEWQEIQAAISFDATSQTVEFDYKKLRDNIKTYCSSLVEVIEHDLSTDLASVSQNRSKGMQNLRCRIDFVHPTARKYVQSLEVDCIVM
jgi:hypothetical protein